MDKPQMAPTVKLRPVQDSDLPIFFNQEQDEEGRLMAGFVADDPFDREAFDQHWKKIRSNSEIILRTILVENAVAGNIAYFMQFGLPSVSYWIGREFWGKGVATEALHQFLDLLEQRPVYARVAHDNTGSIRVLEKCGFTRYDIDRGFAVARGEEIEEWIMIYQ